MARSCRCPRLLDSNGRVQVITWPGPLILLWEEHSPEREQLILGWPHEPWMTQQALEGLALCLEPHQQTVALPHRWPWKCTFLTHNSRENEIPCCRGNLAHPAMGKSGTALERRQADRTLFPHGLCSGKDPPLPSEDTGSFLLSFQLGPKEGPLFLLTGPGGQEGRGIHHTRTPKDAVSEWPAGRHRA